MQLTDFKKVVEDEVVKIKRDSPSVPQNNQFFRQFKEAIWVKAQPSIFYPFFFLLRLISEMDMFS